jgi:hypothetical protein
LALNTIFLLTSHVLSRRLWWCKAGHKESWSNKIIKWCDEVFNTSVLQLFCPLIVGCLSLHWNLIGFNYGVQLIHTYWTHLYLDSYRAIMMKWKSQLIKCYKRFVVSIFHVRPTHYCFIALIYHWREMLHCCNFFQFGTLY